MLLAMLVGAMRRWLRDARNWLLPRLVLSPRHELAGRAVVEEDGARLIVSSALSSQPGATSGFYNPKMALRRTLCVHTLQAAVATPWDKSIGEGLGSSALIRVLDGFSASGAVSIRWAHALQKHGRAGVEITASDMDPKCCDLVEENAALNGMSLRVACADFRVLLLTSAPFDFVHVDPFGSCVP